MKRHGTPPPQFQLKMGLTLARSPKAKVAPEILKWARNSAGLSIESAARRMQTNQERITRWESGVDAPTVKQLRNLARIYKRPLAVFYLPEIPRDFQALKDFRRLPGLVAGVQSPQLSYAIRQAHSRREIAVELQELSGAHLGEFNLVSNPSDEPARRAGQVRQSLNVEPEEQFRWEPGYDSYNHWRAALENAGLLIFQFLDVNLSEARGFSIASSPFPVIAVNIKDAVAGRIFTMMHELCHIFLHDSGLCDVEEYDGRPPEAQRAEVLCNHFAGSLLVPEEHLLQERIVQSKSGADWTDGELQSLSNKYGVSREVILRRLLALEKTTESFYRKKREQFQGEYRSHSERQRERGGFVPPPKLAISQAGKPFVQLVLSNYYENNITGSDVADFLGVRLKHLGAIEAEIFDVQSRRSA